MSVIDPFDVSRFVKSNTCLPCCTAASGCQCALLIPPAFPTPFIPPVNTDSPYASHSDAAGVIATQVADCLVYFNLAAAGSVTSYSVDVTTPNVLIFYLDGNPDGAPGPQTEMWADFSANAGCVMSVSVGFTGSFDAFLYTCDGTLVEEQISIGGSPVSFAPLVSSGEYIIFVVGDTTGSTTFQFTVSGSTTTIFNPVIALWNDSGTTRQLPACPYLFTPPDYDGTWYASCADAASALSAEVSNCVGHISNPSDWNFTATNGGTSLTLAGTPIGTPGVFGSQGCVNATAGGTISVSITALASAGAIIYGISIIDYTGTTILASSSASTLSFPVPYSGPFLVFIGVNSTSPDYLLSVSCSITGITSVNPVQALWDDGLICPNRLNCGDSCP